MSRYALGLLAAAALASVGAQAQTARKAGLWEVQTRMNMPGMPDMQRMLAEMPPAQRAQMEQVMKQQGVALGGAPNSFRYCLSPERASKELVPASDPDTQCEHKMASRSASEVRFSFSCREKDGRRTQGEGRMFDLSAEGYSMEMTVKAPDGDGAMQMQQKGRWLGADCKGLKPVGG